MTLSLTRRRWLAATPAIVPALAFAQPAATPKPRPPALEPDLVKQYVIAGHGDLAKTKALLDETPGLLNATWDWGGGDFETALGGAGHMGNHEIAEFLLSRGARMDIFVAAMLGKLEIVKAIVAAFPGVEKSLGPHKIPLLVHAEHGKSTEVVEYLHSIF